MGRLGFFPYNLCFTIGDAPVNLIHLYIGDLTNADTALRPFMLHQHAHLELQYILAGEGAFITSDQTIPFVPGQLIMIPPETGHRLVSDDPRLQRLIMTLHLFHPGTSARSEEVQRFFASFHALSPTLLTVKPDSALKHTLDDLHRFVRTKMPDPLEMDRLRAYCTLMLLALHHEMPDNTAQYAPRRPHSQQAVYIEDFLRENFASKNLAASLARQLHVSPRQLSRIVRASCGMTLREKLNAIRLDYALNQLITTDTPVARIAQLLGYGSTTAFGSFIKSQTGLTPSQIRSPVPDDPGT